MGELGIEEYLNAFLVRAGVRPAMLVQPADYGEATSSDPRTADVLAAIVSAFPDLILSRVAGETIVATRGYTEADVPTSAAMGRILGYPCADEYGGLDRSRPTTTIAVVATLRSGKEVQLWANVCRDDTHYAEAVRVAAAAQVALQALVVRVEAVRTVNTPPAALIRLLLEGATLTESQQAEIIDCLWNLGLANASTYRYDFANPVHRGILIGLVAVYANDPLSPFFPLQERPEGAAVEAITARLDGEMAAILERPVGRSRSRSRTRVTRRVRSH